MTAEDKNNPGAGNAHVHPHKGLPSPTLLFPRKLWTFLSKPEIASARSFKRIMGEAENGRDIL